MPLLQILDIPDASAQQQAAAPVAKRSDAATLPRKMAEAPAQKRRAAHSRNEGRDARGRPRLKISLPVHVRPFDPRYAEIEEVGQVIDFTRDGLFFRTCMPHYYVGMRLIATFPYGDKVSAHRRMLTTVVRIDRFDDGTRGVAVRVLL